MRNMHSFFIALLFSLITTMHFAHGSDTPEGHKTLADFMAPPVNATCISEVPANNTTTILQNNLHLSKILCHIQSSIKSGSSWIFCREEAVYSLEIAAEDNQQVIAREEKTKRVEYLIKLLPAHIKELKKQLTHYKIEFYTKEPAFYELTTRMHQQNKELCSILKKVKS
ncbi:MAG: hypothetical protein QG632_457 [Candidatus Dependentiae bacterium]|nr:hypothetical protein [Candidatus Dependentiae bacterium]